MVKPATCSHETVTLAPNIAPNRGDLFRVSGMVAKRDRVAGHYR